MSPTTLHARIVSPDVVEGNLLGTIGSSLKHRKEEKSTVLLELYHR